MEHKRKNKLNNDSNTHTHKKTLNEQNLFEMDSLERVQHETYAKINATHKYHTMPFAALCNSFFAADFVVFVVPLSFYSHYFIFVLFSINELNVLLCAILVHAGD